MSDQCPTCGVNKKATMLSIDRLRAERDAMRTAFESKPVAWMSEKGNIIDDVEKSDKNFEYTKSYTIPLYRLDKDWIEFDAQQMLDYGIAAYRAGAEQMRELAAVTVDQNKVPFVDLHELANTVRALPLDDANTVSDKA